MSKIDRMQFPAKKNENGFEVDPREHTPEDVERMKDRELAISQDLTRLFINQMFAEMEKEMWKRQYRDGDLMSLEFRHNQRIYKLTKTFTRDF